MEILQFTYDICHKPGVENPAPDAFSRVCLSLHSSAELRFLHESLGNPGFKVLLFFLNRNLLFSNEAKDVCQCCCMCAEIKLHQKVL